LEGICFQKLNQHQNDRLTARFQEEEVKNAIWDCGSDKCPGPDGGNASFIALIPKVADPQILNDYRPISLIGCMYKIVAKVLANRMKKVMTTIVDETQSAFIEGRHLLHSALIVNEVIEEAKRSNKSCLIFKVDYEKAYDSVSWGFL
ncbi:Transposon TX1 putative 149 kDa protein, partial [Glycine soja]